METTICSVCRKPKGVYVCALCESTVCKRCAQFLKGSPFAFMERVPADLTHGTYCGACFDAKVAPALDAYTDAMERAKSVIVYLKNQGEETRLIKRSERPFVVKDCLDREETLLRLAFLAAEANFNTLVDVHIASKKIRNEAYQTTRWDGSGVPTQLDPKKLSQVEWSAPANNVGTR